MNRRFSSLALFWSFLLLGVFVSVLGPAVPSMSRDVGVNYVAFGRAFSMRGLGSLLGSYGSSVTAFRWNSGERQTELRRLLNNRMYRLGAATAGMGFFAIALTTAPSLAWVCVWCFSQGVCIGAVDAIGNAAISAVHGAGVAPWMQGLHSCFSAGALVAPALVGQLGYSAVLLFLGLLALPAGLVCCVAGGAGSEGNCGENACRSKPSFMEVKQLQGTCDEVFSEGVELLRGERKPETRVNVGLEDRGGVEGQVCGRSVREALLQERDDENCVSAPSGKSPTVSKDIPHRLATAAENRPRNGNAGLIASTSSTQLPPHDAKTTNQTGAERPTVMPTEADENWHSEDIENMTVTNIGSAEIIPGERGGAEEGRPSPFILVGMLTFFLFCYVGAEVGFGAWVAVVVLRDHLASEAVAASIASLFWGGITAGRLLAVPLAVRFSTDSLVRANLLGCLLSSTLLLAVGRESLGWTVTGAGLFGVCMASMFPLAMSLLPSWGYALSEKNSSRMVIGGTLGEMIVPAAVASLLGPNDGGRPSALYAVCGAVSLLMIGVYGVWCRLAGDRPLKM